MARPDLDPRACWQSNTAIDCQPLRIRIYRLAAAALALAPLLVLAQSSSASYQIPRQTIDGGAGRSNSASFTVDASLGQPDAGQPMSSASFTLRGGFHRASSGAPRPPQIFRDGFESP